MEYLYRPTDNYRKNTSRFEATNRKNRTVKLDFVGTVYNCGLESESPKGGSLVDDINKHVSQEEPTLLEVPVVKE